MSTQITRARIEQLKIAIKENAGWSSVQISTLHALEELLEVFGSVLGRAKVDFPAYSEQLSKLDQDARSYFQILPKFVHELKEFVQYCMLGVQKVSEAIAIVERLDNPPQGMTVAKQEYDRLASENEIQKRVIKMLSESRGYPDLLNLTSIAKSGGIEVDENWVLAVCAVNLIEAAVNKKLEDLGQSIEGDFSKKLSRLTVAVKESEGRIIQQMLPSALYDKVRHRLDHASHKYHPTEAEAENIYRDVASFLQDLFRSKT